MRVTAAILVALMAASLSDALDVQTIISKIQTVCEARGCSSLHEISEHFKISDNDGDQMLTSEEFVMAMHHFNLPGVTDEDFHAVFQEFDSNGSGSLDYDEFVSVFHEEVFTVRLV